MRRTYFSTFLVGRCGENPPAAKTVLDYCEKWACDKPRRLDCSRVPRPLTDGDYDLGGKGNLKFRTVDTEKDNLYGIQFEHVDSRIESNRWRTDICIKEDKISSKLRIAVSLSFGTISSDMCYNVPSSSRPQIVKNIVEGFGACEDRSITCAPIGIDKNNFLEFANFLFDPARSLPIVIVSSKNVDDKPIADPAKVADQLVGLSHVYVFKDRFPAFRLTDLVGHGLSCYDGSVRIYWPKFSRREMPYKHPLFRSNHVRRDSIHAILLSKISSISINRRPDDVLSFSSIERILHEQRFSQLKSKLQDSNDHYELTELYKQENENLLKRISGLVDKNTQLRQELSSKSQLVDIYRNDNNDLRKRLADIGADAPQLVQTPIESVRDAFGRVLSEFPDRVVLQFISSSNIDTPFDDLDSLYQALLFLATDYYDSKCGNNPKLNISKELFDSCGFKYSANQSSATTGQYKDYYQLTYNGKRVTLEEHVKRGEGRDPRRSIRIAFYFDKITKKIIFGYVGQHQKTRAS